MADMKWSDVRNEKVKLTQEVVSKLDEVEKALLIQLLGHERKNRNKSGTAYKIFYRDQLDSRITTGDDSDT